MFLIRRKRNTITVAAWTIILMLAGCGPIEDWPLEQRLIGMGVWPAEVSGTVHVGFGEVRSGWVVAIVSNPNTNEEVLVEVTDALSTLDEDEFEFGVVYKFWVNHPKKWMGSIVFPVAEVQRSDGKT